MSCVTIEVWRGRPRRAGLVTTEANIATPSGRARKKPIATDPGPFRSRSLAPIGWIVSAVFVGVALLFYFLAPADRPARPAQAPVAEQPIPPPPPPPKRAASRVSVEPDTPNDLLGRAADYKAVYVRYRESRDPIERALAGRAHRACFPTFLPPHGQAPTTAYVLNALPVEHRAERKEAIETLFARCRSFLVQPMDVGDIVSTAERATNGDLATPGASARWSLIRGERAAAEAIVQRALTSREPYALQSLSGLSVLLMNEGANGADPGVTDAALALLACDLGAACGADSLLALQLCAAEGRCDGTARERMLERIGPVDMEAVERERRRLRALFDRGNATLGTVFRGGR